MSVVSEREREREREREMSKCYSWIEDEVRMSFDSERMSVGEVEGIVEEVRENEYREMMKNSEGRNEYKRKEVWVGEMKGIRRYRININKI